MLCKYAPALLAQLSGGRKQGITFLALAGAYRQHILGQNEPTNCSSQKWQRPFCPCPHGISSSGNCILKPYRGGGTSPRYNWPTLKSQKIVWCHAKNTSLEVSTPRPICSTFWVPVSLPILKGRSWAVLFLRSFSDLILYHFMQSTLYRMFWMPGRLG